MSKEELKELQEKYSKCEYVRLDPSKIYYVEKGLVKKHLKGLNLTKDPRLAEATIVSSLALKHAWRIFYPSRKDGSLDDKYLSTYNKILARSLTKSGNVIIYFNYNPIHDRKMTEEEYNRIVTFLQSSDEGARRMGELLICGFSIFKNEAEIVAFLNTRRKRSALTVELRRYRRYLISIGYIRL